MQFELITDTKGLAEMRQPWTELLISQTSPSPFMSWEWVNAWWTVYGSRRQLRIGVVRDGNSILGIAPLAEGLGYFSYWSPRGALSFISSDTRSWGMYFDMLVDRHAREEATLNLLDGLWDTTRQPLWLVRMPCESETLRIVTHWAQTKRHSVILFPDRSCLWGRLPGSVEEFERTLPKKRRWELRKNAQTAEELGSVEYQTCDDAQAVLSLLPEAAQIGIRFFRDKGMRSNFQDPRFVHCMETFCRSATGAGMVTAYALRIAKDIASIWLVLRAGRGLYLWQPATNPDFRNVHPSILLLKYIVDRAIEDRVERIDFMNSGHAYMRHFAGSVRYTVRLAVLPHNLRTVGFSARILSMHSTRFLLGKLRGEIHRG